MCAFSGDVLQGPQYLNNGANLYVREVFTDIMEHLKESLKKREKYPHLAIRVTGTPGVGKSAFLVYVKQELVKLNKSVFVTMQDYHVHYHGKKCTLNADPSMLSVYPTGERMIHLLDPGGFAVKPTNAITILFVSPDKRRYGGFSRDNIIDYYMPPWRLHELIDCCRICYGMEDDAQVTELFEKWGGSIRKIVNINSDSSFTHQYEASLSNFLTSEDLLKKINEVQSSHLAYDDRSRNSQWVLHRWPGTTEEGRVNYCTCDVDFPSQYIKMKIRERLSQYSIDWKASSGNSILLGKLYENEVLLNLFKRTSDVRVCFLRHEAECIGRPSEPVQVPVVRRYIVFSNQSKIDEPVIGALYTPVESNKAGINFIMPPWIFQSTIKKNHDVKQLENICKQFQSVKEWNMCFVIPSCVREKFKFPKLNVPTSVRVKRFILIFDAETLT